MTLPVIWVVGIVMVSHPIFIILIPVKFRIFPSLHNYINHKSKSWSTSNLFIALGDIILKDFQIGLPLH